MINLKGQIVPGVPADSAKGVMYFVPTDDGKFNMYVADNEGIVRQHKTGGSDLLLVDATNDETFVKQVVAKEDGTLGLVDKDSGGETTSDDIIVLKDSTEYSTSNEAYKIVGPDISVKGGRWVNVTITMNVKSTAVGKGMTIALIPKTTPYDVFKNSYFKTTGTGTAMNTFIVGNITNTQNDLPNTGIVGNTSGFQITGSNIYNKVTIDGSFYLNADNTVNLVVKQHTLDPSYTFYIENINVKIE